VAGGDISPLASGARLIAAAPAQVLFEPFARPLLLAHAVVGFAALGSATHLAAYALLAARRGREVHWLMYLLAVLFVLRYALLPA